MTFEEANEHRDVPMWHIIGDHTTCGDWCLEKRTKAEKSRTTNHQCLI